MNDLISRQDVIDAIDEYMVGKNCASDGTMMARLINELVIKRLPSAQPKTNYSESPNTSDCISRQQAIKDAESWVAVDEYEKHLQKNVVEWLKEFPSAQPTFDARDTQYNLPIGTDCISRQAVKELLNNNGLPYHINPVLWKQLNELPPAEPKVGRWERHYSRPNVYADLLWHCSECGYKNSENYAPAYHHYCPNCGAKMEVTK